jgi:hypothetical protein
MKVTGKNSIIALIAAVLSVVTAIGEIIYGVKYSQYADYVVVLTYIVGGALFAAYALTNTKITEWFNLAGVVFSGFGLGLFITNSYNVWADTWGNLNQYGSLTGEFSFFNSQGGPFPAVALIVLGLVSVILGVVCCFGRKENA